VLDVGAGDGLFAVLALLAGAGSVVALEPDLRKVFRAARQSGVHRVAGYVDAVGGRFDLITLFDVLYRVPLDERDRLLGALRDRLLPGGKLLIKELDPEQRVKASWNRAQEWVSDTLFGLTLGSGLHYETTSRLLDRLAGCGLEHCAVEQIGTGYPHSHVAYTALAPGRLSSDPTSYS
jgi:SAM-dependent methyltransferase